MNDKRKMLDEQFEALIARWEPKPEPVVPAPVVVAPQKPAIERVLRYDNKGQR